VGGARLGARDKGRERERERERIGERIGKRKRNTEGETMRGCGVVRETAEGWRTLAN
jgi:hypothetical protein